MVIIASLEKASEEVMFMLRPNKVIHEGGKVVRNRLQRAQQSGTSKGPGSRENLRHLS